MMKITTLQDNLVRALRAVRRAVPARPTIPITQNILISAEDSRVRVAATDLELSITTWLGAQVHNVGQVTVPARPLLDLVSTFSDGRVELEVIEEPFGLVIETSTELASGGFASRKTTLRGTPATDYPQFPVVEGDHAVRVESGILRNALERVVFAAAAEDARPVLTGIKMEVKGDKATFAAADGFRLSVEEAQLREPSETEFEALIPRHTMTEVLGLLSGITGMVDISVSEDGKMARFMIADEYEVLTQLVAGTYPDFRSLIPENTDTSVDIHIDGVNMLSRSAAVIARDGSSIVRMHVKKDEEEAEGKVPGELQLTASAEEVGDTEGDAPVQVEGPDGKIAFNVRFIRELVDHATGGASQMYDYSDDDDLDRAKTLMVMQITSPSSPAVFRLPDHPGFTHVVMPMYVQW